MLYLTLCGSNNIPKNFRLFIVWFTPLVLCLYLWAGDLFNYSGHYLLKADCLIALSRPELLRSVVLSKGHSVRKLGLIFLAYREYSDMYYWTVDVCRVGMLRTFPKSPTIIFRSSELFRGFFEIVRSCITSMSTQCGWCQIELLSYDEVVLGLLSGVQPMFRFGNAKYIIGAFC